jgi:hypothetical protein
VLAVTTPKRVAAVQDWRTLAESGLPGFGTSLWVGLLAPAGTPKDIVDFLNVEVRRIVKVPDVVGRMVSQGADLVGNSPAEFKEFIAAESAKYARIIKQQGIRGGKRSVTTNATQLVYWDSLPFGHSNLSSILLRVYQHGTTRRVASTDLRAAFSVRNQIYRMELVAFTRLAPCARKTATCLLPLLAPTCHQYVLELA